MAITYHSGRRLQGLSTDTPPTADFTEDFSEATPTTWTEDSSGGSYAAHLEPYKGSVNRLWFDMDYSTTEKTSGTLDLANASLLGSNVSDTKWVMRFKINFDNFVSDGAIWVGLSDNAGASDVAQRFIGCRLKADSGFSCGGDNGGAALTTTNATNGGTTSISDNTDYYVTIERKSLNLYTSTIRETSHTNTTILGTGDDTTISSSQDDLKYWKVMNHLAAGGAGSNARGYIYDLEIYDGISSVSPVKPTNVQVGSRFEETDTRKMYHYNQATEVQQLVYGSSTGIYTSGGGESDAGINIKADSALIGISVSQVSFYVKQEVNPATENLIYCRLYRSGAYVHTFGTTDPDNITVGSFGWYSFGTSGDADAGNGSIELEEGDRILLTWDRGGAYNDTALRVGHSTSDVYDGTATNHIKLQGTTWTEYDAKDTCFKIVGTGFPKTWSEEGT